MKKFVIFLFVISCSTVSFAQEKPKIFVGGGYEFHGMIDGVNIRSGLEFDDSRWRIVGEYTHHIRRGKYLAKAKSFDIGLTAQYVFKSTDKFDFYALAGVSYFGGSLTYRSPDRQDEHEIDYNSVRLKLGIGAEYHILPNLDVYSEFQLQDFYDRLPSLNRNLKAGVKYKF